MGHLHVPRHRNLALCRRDSNPKQDPLLALPPLHNRHVPDTLPWHLATIFELFVRICERNDD